jgi:hypothetical protein
VLVPARRDPAWSARRRTGRERAFPMPIGTRRPRPSSAWSRATVPCTTPSPALPGRSLATPRRSPAARS